MKYRMTLLFMYLIQFFFLPCYSEGKELTLHDAINVYVYNTRYVRTKRLAFENTLMEYENFRKALLPAFSLNLRPVSFNHSMRLLQNYITGEYTNVEEFSNTTSGGVSVIQKVAATGGVLTLGSSLSYLREFSSGRNSFSSVPLYISYSQSLLGGGKSMRFERSIAKLKNDMAMKQFCTSVSTEQQKILSLYLDAYVHKVDIDFYSKTVNMGDSLLTYAKMRRDADRITDFEYNQVELQQLDNRMALEKAVHAYAASIRLLANELSLREIELGKISVASFPASIDEETVMCLVDKNNPEYQTLEIDRLNAAYALHKTKVSNRFNADVSVIYGLNQYAKTIKDAYSRPDQQQAVSVTFSIPVFQWGINRNKLKMAKNEYDMVLSEQKRTLDNFKEEIHNCVVGYNMNKSLADVAEKKYELSARQYSLAVMRFKANKMAAIELTDANRDYLQAKQNYISVQKELLVSYYKIRHLSLHDFVENKDMEELVRKTVAG